MNNGQPSDAHAIEAAGASRTSDAANRKRNRSSDIKVFEDESFNEEDTDNAIRNLKEAKYNVAARVDYANEVHEANNPGGKQAYAKIAGNGWTFYVDELEIRIGRPPDERQSEGHPGGLPREARLDKSLVHIDLGPSKLVSRQHAEIRYDEHSAQWYIAVNGRNGVKVDNDNLGRGQTGVLHSGCVIEIAGTQMMFVTPNEVPTIHPSISVQSRPQHDNEYDEDDVDLMPAPSLPHRTPTRRDGSHSGGQQQFPSSNAHSPSRTRPTQRGTQDLSVAPSAFAPYNNPVDAPAPTSQVKSRTSPTFPKGLMLETAEDIDYAVDSAKDLKPPHSYAQLIGMAILSTSEEKLTLARIYDWIKERYAFYRFSGGGWQNSIRHNLSLNKSFEKVARRTDEPGKGMKWQIVPEYRDEFMKKGLSHARRPPGRGSSAPNSPSKDLSSAEARPSEHMFSQDNQDGSADDKRGTYTLAVKTSPGSTPPVARYGHIKQTHTPDQSSNHFGHQRMEISSPVKGAGMGISPFPYSAKNYARWNGLTEAAAAGSPGGPRISLGSEPYEHLVTPLFTRQAPRLAPPSTSRLPSQFMPLSSPAPFWKYADYGSTPARANGVTFGTSPIKDAKLLVNGHKHDNGGYAKESEEVEDVKVGGIRSSSPPVPDGDLGQESPTRALSQRGNDYKPILIPPPAISQAPQVKSGTTLPQPNGLRIGGHGGTPVLPPPVSEDDDDDEEGGMIDLARYGFRFALLFPVLLMIVSGAFNRSALSIAT